MLILSCFNCLNQKTMTESTFDCNNCIKKCKGSCCTAVPFTMNFITSHTPIREIILLADMSSVAGPNVVMPVTKDGHCPFQNIDGSCSCYDTRPPICRIYGDGSHPYLTCPYQAPDGRIRSRTERRKIEKDVARRMKKTLSPKTK